MKLSPEEEHLFNILRHDHVGRENGIGGKSLVDKSGLRHRLLRETIESLVTVHRIPIGSDPVYGYYIIASEIEYRKARHELSSRIGALSQRIKALDRSFATDVAVAGQTPIPFPGEEPQCA